MTDATVVTVPAAIERSRRVDRWFYISMALVMLHLSIIGFGPSLIDPSTRNVPLPLTPIVLAHGIVAVAWLLIFLAQATLVATDRTAIHRRLGMVGAVLTVAFVALGYFTVIEVARRGFDMSGDLTGRPPGPGAPALTGVLCNLFAFGTLAGVGLCYRHRPEVHKRLMLLAMLFGLSNTPMGHLVACTQ